MRLFINAASARARSPLKISAPAGGNAPHKYQQADNQHEPKTIFHNRPIACITFTSHLAKGRASPPPGRPLSQTQHPEKRTNWQKQRPSGTRHSQHRCSTAAVCHDDHGRRRATAHGDDRRQGDHRPITRSSAKREYESISCLLNRPRGGLFLPHPSTPSPTLEAGLGAARMK